MRELRTQTSRKSPTLTQAALGTRRSPSFNLKLCILPTYLNYTPCVMNKYSSSNAHGVHHGSRTLPRQGHRCRFRCSSTRSFLRGSSLAAHPPGTGLCTQNQRRSKGLTSPSCGYNKYRATLTSGSPGHKGGPDGGLN